MASALPVVLLLGPLPYGIKREINSEEKKQMWIQWDTERRKKKVGTVAWTSRESPPSVLSVSVVNIDVGLWCSLFLFYLDLFTLLLGTTCTVSGATPGSMLGDQMVLVMEPGPSMCRTCTWTLWAASLALLELDTNSVLGLALTPGGALGNLVGGAGPYSLCYYLFFWVCLIHINLLSKTACFMSVFLSCTRIAAQALKVGMSCA